MEDRVEFGDPHSEFRMEVMQRTILGFIHFDEMGSTEIHSELVFFFLLR
jgi:hypothetical protein